MGGGGGGCTSPLRKVSETLLQCLDISASIESLKTQGQNSVEQKAMGVGAPPPEGSCQPDHLPRGSSMDRLHSSAAPNKVAESFVVGYGWVS